MRQNWNKHTWKEILIILESLILFLILFRNWDEVKAWLSGLFS